MPGTMNNLLKPGGKYAVDMDQYPIDTTELEGNHWGRRSRFPGSTKVWSRANNTLSDCTDHLCPDAETVGGRRVNFAPYFAEGGEAYSIRASAGNRTKSMLVDFFSWLTELPISEIPLSGQYSQAQLEPDAVEQFANNTGWPAIMIADLLGEDGGLLPQLFAKDGNQAQDLLILGFSDYMDVARSSLLTRVCGERILPNPTLAALA
jgi:hypothetical protein